MKKYVLTLFLLASWTAHAVDIIKEGLATIRINPSTLYPVKNDNFYMLLEWPEINSWSDTIHPTKIKWLSKNRNEEIQQALLLASAHHGTLNAHITNSLSTDTRYYNPLCHPRGYMTCEDLGFPPDKKIVEKWDNIKIEIPPNLEFESFILLSREVSDI